MTFVARSKISKSGMQWLGGLLTYTQNPQAGDLKGAGCPRPIFTFLLFLIMEELPEYFFWYENVVLTYNYIQHVKINCDFPKIYLKLDLLLQFLMQSLGTENLCSRD